MDARCQMQERGEREKGDEPWSPPPDAATHHSLADGHREARKIN